MIRNRNETYRKVRILTAAEAKPIKQWIEQQIDNYLKSNSEFTVKDLFGGDNYFWGQNGFPIQLIFDKYYDKYINKGWSHDESVEMAVAQAGIAVGWLVKSVANKSQKHLFDIERRYRQIVYKEIAGGINAKKQASQQ